MKNRFLLLLVFGLGHLTSLTGQEVFESELIVSGLDNPIGIVHAGDERLFIIEQTGFIRIVSEGEVLEEPFLDLSESINVDGFERGLLGLAFHPDFASNGTFFVNYTGLPDGQTVVSRFSVAEDNPNRADPESEEVLLTVEQPFRNHNGGQLLFGPDGYLYIALGDGGSANDPDNRAQNLEVLLGKMLRIDVDLETDAEYAIPPDNPFADDEDALDEIWAYGLRNPWRSSFDRYTGDFWIGDVGQGDREEINFQPAESSGGENYGWRCYEGNMPFNGEGCDDDSAYVFPVYDYNHEGEGCTGSVVGGYVYRGSLYSGWFGSYFFADYCTGNMYRIDTINGEYEGALVGNVGAAEIASFGEDLYGELYYAMKGSGEIYRLSDPVDCEPLAVIMHGDSVRYLELNDTTLLEAFYNPALEYQWYKDEVMLEGQNEHVLEVSEEGNYTVEVTNSSNDCAGMSEPVEVAMLSTQVELKDLNRISVFPNPVNDVLYIQRLPATRNITVSLYNIVGSLLHHEMVQQAGTYILNLSSYQAGTYYLRIVSGEEVLQEKVVK